MSLAVTVVPYRPGAERIWRTLGGVDRRKSQLLLVQKPGIYMPAQYAGVRRFFIHSVVSPFHFKRRSHSTRKKLFCGNFFIYALQQCEKVQN
jgi:hypothetical protein